MSGGGSTTAIDKGLLIPCCYCTINCGALSAAAALLGGDSCLPGVFRLETTSTT